MEPSFCEPRLTPFIARGAPILSRIFAGFKFFRGEAIGVVVGVAIGEVVGEAVGDGPHRSDGRPGGTVATVGLDITPSGQVCGATITGVDLAAALDPDTVAAIRTAWLEHHVLAFPGQAMTDDDLERFTLYFGPFGDDPYIAPIEGREHVIAISRRADETSPLFAENFHSDWSFQVHPPAGTCLFGITIPPVGGDTLFADQRAALDAMPADLRSRLEGRMAIHSARSGYAPDGMYGESEQEADRSIDIRPSVTAMATHQHPIIRAHPETGRLGLFSCIGYIIGIDGMADDEARELLIELYHWQTRDEFVYRHRWEPNMLTMWDNRSVLHRATGGYDGHDRVLHRTTIGAIVPA